MTDPLLAQSSGMRSAEFVLLVSDYVTVTVALIIAYIAYQGYSRNNSRPMLFIAAGFVLTFGGPGLIFLVSRVVPTPPLVVGGATQIIELLGMATMLYGFIAPSRI